MWKIFLVAVGTLSLASGDGPPLGPGGILRPWNWPTVIPPVPVAQEPNPKPATVAATIAPAGKPDVVVTAPPPTIVHVRSERLTLGADGAFETASVWDRGTLAVYRNGLRQMPGLDYAEERDSKRIVPLALFSSTDLVLVDYEKGGR
ncbi:MAG: hypothetical protein M3Z85_12185 [Acidobacteriota bacterium]|nr:hypothetical protein [Acidobacteriota bacterium]